jgi:hypothetical protein
MEMKRLILYSLFTLHSSLFLGCATTPTALIPVATPCPQPPQLVRPHLAIQELQPVAAPSEVFRAYVITIEQLKGYAVELETIINGYRK